MHTDPNRAFSYAVLASIVLHALLLFGFSHRYAPKRPAPPAPLLARLVQPPVVQMPVVEPAPRVPQSEPVQPPTRPKPQARRPAVKPAPVAKPVPVPELAAEPPVIEAVPPTYQAPSEASSAPPSVVARTEPTPPPAAPTAETMDAGSLAQYRLQLLSKAPKYKRYPRVAIDNNWEGKVVVRMVVGANGGISELIVKTSSGHEVLDQQALEMFKKAKPLVEIPPALRGKEFTLELTAIYNLRDRDSG